MTLAKRLIEAREKSGLTQAQLAEKVGIKQQSIYQIEDGQTKKPRHIEKIAEVLNVSSSWLLFGEPGGAEIINKNKVPVYSWDGIFNEKKITDFIDPVILSSNNFALKVEDDSMRNFYEHTPTFPAGTIIIINNKTEAKPGKYVIARQKDNPDAIPIFRRYIASTAGKKLMPLNGALYDKEDAENFDIIGVVVASMNLDL